MNDLGFDIIMGGNDYEFIGKTMTSVKDANVHVNKGVMLKIIE